MFNLTGTEQIVAVVLSVVWAVVGYVLSERTRRATGRTPWGLPSLVWAFIWFLSLLIGLVLYLIANAGASRRLRSTGGPPPPGWDVSSQFPSYPRPANSGPGDVGGGPGERGPTERGPTERGPEWPATGRPVSPPAWHPDPSGRYQYRWWDGRQWTSQVSSGGQHLVDTDPDQRIGPY